jgi:hypothetical protein
MWKTPSGSAGAVEKQKVEIDLWEGIGQTWHKTFPVPLPFFRRPRGKRREGRGERRFEVEPRNLESGYHDPGLRSALTRDTLKGGLGLISMRERLKLVHGELSIHAEPGRGTTIHACVPVALNNPSTRTAAAAG